MTNAQSLPTPSPATDPLAALRDIHLPEAIGWWPPAPGWWLLLGIILVTIATIYGCMRWRKKQQNKIIIFSTADSIDAALMELDAIVQAFKLGDSDQCNRQMVADMSQLLRRTAIQLNTHDGNHVAGLTGTAWLAWLDQRWQRDDFMQGAGSILIDAPYRKNPPNSDEVNELCSISQTWLEQQRR